MLNSLKTLAIAATVLVAAAFTSTAIAGSLKLNINNVKSSKGVIQVFVFKSSKAFNSNNYNKATKYLKIRAKAGAISKTISGLAPGKYAVSIFHDKNNNNKFDMRGQYPLEGYAYSNNVGTQDYPKFNQAAVTVGASTSISMNMLYY